jgi:DNA polymerase-3 subunit beta
MKFTINSDLISKNVTVITKIISDKPTAFSLKGFLIETQKDKVIFSSSDGAGLLRKSLNLEGDVQEGKAYILGKTFFDLLKTIENQDITFENQQGGLQITWQGGNALLPVSEMSSSEKGIIKNKRERPDNAVEVTFEGKSFIKAFTIASQAASNDKIRPYLCAVEVKTSPEKTTMVGTDSRRLSIIDLDNIKSGTEASILIPSDYSSLIKAAFAKTEGKTSIELNGSYFVIKDENTEFICNTVPGNFPQWEKVVPKDNPIKVTADVASLCSAINRVLVCTAKTTGVIKVEFSPELVTITAEDKMLSFSGKEKIACQSEGEPSVVMYFNGDYLLEALKSLDDKSAVITLKDEKHPILITTDSKDEHTRQIVMPNAPMK